MQVVLAEDGRTAVESFRDDGGDDAARRRRSDDAGTRRARDARRDARHQAGSAAILMSGYAPNRIADVAGLVPAEAVHARTRCGRRCESPAWSSGTRRPHADPGTASTETDDAAVGRSDHDAAGGDRRRRGERAAVLVFPHAPFRSRDRARRAGRRSIRRTRGRRQSPETNRCARASCRSIAPCRWPCRARAPCDRGPPSTTSAVGQRRRRVERETCDRDARSATARAGVFRSKAIT